ncbi:hypothetical protein MD484_g463, partial [Candolleomyces efflorescens]
MLASSLSQVDSDGPQDSEIARFTKLYSLNIIPLRVVFYTLEDEVRYIWSQKRCLGKSMFLFIRYYTIFLLIFDVLQIHLFTIPGVTSDIVCVATDPIVRMLGAVSLWAVEIIMQLRIHALYNRSRKVVIFNGVLFVLSIAAFLVIMVQGTMRRGALIASAIRLPLPGCPSINGGIQWSLWIPAMAFEIVLFGFALYRSARSLTIKTPLQGRPSLTAILLGDNILYFLGVSALLILLNIMSVGTTLIPWFGFGYASSSNQRFFAESHVFYSFRPFHAAIGIMTTHMLMHLRKATIDAELTEFAKLSGDSNPADIDIDEIIGAINGGVPKFIISTSTRSSFASCSSTMLTLEADVEQFAESSGCQGQLKQRGCAMI